MIEWNKHKLSKEEWNELDELILVNQIIQPIRLVVKSLSIGISEAKELVHQRHLYLRETIPDSFNCSYEDYYKDIHN